MSCKFITCSSSLFISTVFPTHNVPPNLHRVSTLANSRRHTELIGRQERDKKEQPNEMDAYFLITFMYNSLSHFLHHQRHMQLT